MSLGMGENDQFADEADGNDLEAKDDHEDRQHQGRPVGQPNAQEYPLKREV